MKTNEAISTRKVAKNILWGFLAQGTALLASIVMSFVVAKLISVVQYSYWQLFIFYLSYVCFFHFGLPDGIYLRFGGKHYEELDKIAIGSQLKLMVIFHTFISAFIIMMAFFYVKDSYRVYVLVFTAVYLVLMNLFNYLGMVLQAVNRTQDYSKGVIIDRIVFLTSILVLCFCRVKTFVPFAILYLLSRIISILFIGYRTKDIIFSQLKLDSSIFQELKDNVRIGINLTISVISSMLIIGIGRSLIDINYGIETFGKLALTLSLTNFFLNFISQVSMVLFPALRTINRDSLNKLYTILNSCISLGLTISLLCFYPIAFLLREWLPDYASSLIYLSIIMPICVFEGKNQILGNTYLKVLRCEKKLLCINLISMFLSAFMCIISVYVLNDMICVLYSILISIFIKYLLSSVAVQNKIGVKEKAPILFELVISLVFIICNKYLSYQSAFVILLIVIIVYLFTQKRELLSIYSVIKGGRK